MNAKVLLARTAYKKIGRPEKVADTIYFLSSEKASYITGTSIMVDGGYTEI